MLKNIDLSVIVPVYNLEKYIEKSLNSIMNQMVDKVELILVNDGSTDNSLALIKAMAEKYSDKNIIVIDKENGGVSRARNAGIVRATGNYIQFFDGDDILVEGAVKKILEKMEEEPDYICYGFDSCLEDLTIVDSYREHYGYLQEVNQTNLLKSFLLSDGIYLSICAGVMKRSIIEKHNLLFTEGLKLSEDTEYLLKFIAYVKKAIQIPEVLMLYVQREGSAVHSMGKTLGDEPFAPVDIFNRILSLWEIQGVSREVCTLLTHVRIPKDILFIIIQLHRIGAVNIFSVNKKIPFMYIDMMKKAKKNLFSRQLIIKYYLMQSFIYFRPLFFAVSALKNINLRRIKL